MSIDRCFDINITTFLFKLYRLPLYSKVYLKYHLHNTTHIYYPVGSTHTYTPTNYPTHTHLPYTYTPTNYPHIKAIHYHSPTY